MSEILDRGIGIRVGVSGGDDGTQMEATFVLPQFSTQFEINVAAKKAVRAFKAIRAEQQLPELRHEHDATLEILHENRTRLVQLDAEFEVRNQQRAEQIAQKREDKTDKQSEMIEEWYESGRRTEWQPRGGEKSEISKFDQTVANLITQQEKAEAEHKVARTQLENEIKKRQTAIVILDRRIEECVRLARGEDISGVSDGSADL